MQKHLMFRKKDLIIAQGAAFRIQRGDNNTYSVRVDGTTFEDVVILVMILKETSLILVYKSYI